MPMTPDERTAYVANLMRRMDSEELAPGVERLESTADQIGFRAYREAESLADLELLPAIEAALDQTDDYDKLAAMLEGLIRNTRDPQCINAFLAVLKAVRDNESEAHYVIARARKLRLPECRDMVRQHLQSRDGMTLAETIGYLGDVGEASDVAPIASLLERECDGICHPMYCVFALESLGGEEAVQALRQAAERLAGSAEGRSREAAAYARSALERLCSGVRVVSSARFQEPPPGPGVDLFNTRFVTGVLRELEFAGVTFLVRCEHRSPRTAIFLERRDGDRSQPAFDVADPAFLTVARYAASQYDMQRIRVAGQELSARSLLASPRTACDPSEQ